MNYFDIVRQIDEEYRLKRRKAEFDATVRLQRIIKDHPEIDAADTALRRAMREYGWGNISKEDVMRAKAAFETALALKNIDIRVIQPQYECDICKDTGKTDSGRCRCFLQKVYSRLYSFSDRACMPCFENFDLSVFPDEVPEGYRLTQKKLMENLLYQAQNYSDGFPDNEKPNILLLGKTGVGKTYLAMCIVRAVMDKGYAVLSTNAFGLFERLAQRLSGQDIDLNHIRQADLLFIDDLGMEPVLNNFTIEYLFEILNARLLNRKNTIITSNLTAKELQERYTDRITSRLFDQANSLVIYMPGKDLRLSKRQTKQ